MSQATRSQRTRFWLGALVSVPRQPIMLPRVLASRRAPLIALALIMAFSAGARVYQIKQPCRSPCTAPFSRLIFDELFYVNAARSIAGLPPAPGSPYSPFSPRFVAPPSGDDPNPVHPQLAKVVMAGAIELFGRRLWRLRRA